MSWKCPRCGEEIDNVNYQVSTSGREYGSAYIHGTNDGPPEINNHETDDSDSDWDEDMEYKCPECDEEIDPTLLIEIEEDEIIETPKPPEVEETDESDHKIIRPSNPIILNNSRYSTESSMVCKNCRHVYLKGGCEYDLENINECPQCNTTMSVKEYTQLKNDGYYNTNDNTRNNKTKSRSVTPMG
jgi:phage FluMu protein Com